MANSKKEIQIEFVQAQNTEADFQGFLKLEEEFSQYYETLGIGEQYGRVSFKEQSLSDHRAEFEEYLEAGNFFFFAKDKGNYIGYVAGRVEEMPRGYKIRQVGYLDSIIVSEKYRNHGVGKQMCDKFFNWLKQKNITICQIHVKAKNPQVLELYKNWGFEVDELRLWKKI